MLITFASWGATAIDIAGLGGGLPIYCRGGMASDVDARARRRVLQENKYILSRVAG
jgi:hypothetical protein